MMIKTTKRFSPWLASVLVMVAGVVTSHAACDYPDDHENEHAFATPIGPGTVSGVINEIEDRDLFRFIAIPGVSYSFTVTRAGSNPIPDLEVFLVAGDETTVISRSDTLPNNNPAQAGNTSVTISFSPPSSGGGGPMYLDVRSFAEFYKGTYTVQMTSNAGPDSDGDGMTDAWEIANGLDPNVNDADLDPDGDCISNYDEFVMGLNPQSYSPLRFTDHIKGGRVSANYAGLGNAVISPDLPNSYVRWNVRRYVTYRLYTSYEHDHIDVPNWNFIAAHTETANTPSHVHVENDGALYGHRVYRLEVITR